MPNLEPIKGLIELTDNFTSKLGIAEAGLQQFSARNQESLKAVAEAAGLVAGAVIAIGAATIELGKHGSEVNEVDAALEQFAGGAQHAEEIVAALRTGVRGTVDDFALAKDATHLLSTGVQLTTDDFHTLGQAAITLKERGLGGTKEQLELVSDALVTGRTRALAMSLGVQENDKAEEDYAKTLGISADQLSKAGKVEATRIEVMRELREATKNAKDTQKDFGEEFDFVNAKVDNFVDDVGKSIDKSEVFKVGLKGLEDAFGSAFGGKQGDLIKTVTGFVEQGAIAAVGFAQVVLTGAKIVEGAWNGVRTVVLGLETVVVGVATGVVAALSAVSNAAAKVHIISPEAAQGITDIRINLDGMTQSLKDQTVEAAKGVLGHTAFDDTLDQLSDTLGKVKASMLGVTDSTAKNSEATDIAAKNAKVIAAAQAEWNARMIDGQKVAAALEKSTRELAAIQAQYALDIAKSSGTARDAQVADIEAVFQKQVASLDKTDPLFKQKYSAYRDIANEALNNIGSDWQNLAAQSQESLQQQADAAYDDYQKMSLSGLTFSRDVLQAQLQKYRDLQAAANNYGRSTVDAVTAVSDAVKLLDHSWVTDADIAASTINKTTVMVKTLSGEVISLEEAQKRQQQGFSYQVAAVDQFTIDTTPGGADALLDRLTYLSQNLTSLQKNVTDFASQDVYIKALAEYNGLRDAYNLLVGQEKRKHPGLTGFAEGGTVMVGEQGPEVVRLPLGSTVYPNGMNAPGTGGNATFHNTFIVNGTGAQVAADVSKRVMKQLKQTKQFGSA